MAQSNATPVYADGILIKNREVTFASGDTANILKVSIDVAKFAAWLEENKNQKGWVSLDIKERRTPSDKGYTHNAVLDTWEPSNSGGGNSAPARAAAPAGKPAGKPKPKPQAPAADPDDDNIPF